MSRVLLVYPQHGFFGWNSLGKHGESCYQNHGLNQLSAMLKAKGHQVDLADTRAMTSWEGFEQLVAWVTPDVVGIYCSSPIYREAKEAAKLLKELEVSRVAIGGPHPSIPWVAEELAKENCFDTIFLGEGELDFPDWVEGTLEGKLLRCRHPDLDSLPYEDRGLFDQAKTIYSHHPFYPSPWVSVIAGRGCPYHCSFCDGTQYGGGEAHIFGKFRRRSVSHLMGEIKWLAKTFNYAILQLDDDTFLLPPWSWLEDFISAYGKIARPFICQARADTIVQHPDLLSELAGVGLRYLQIGFEVGYQRGLDFLQKGTTVEQNMEAAALCKKLGIKIWANFMLGIPTETKEEARATIEMVKRINPEHPSPAFFTPTPGSLLYQYCQKQDLILDVSLPRSPNSPKIKGVDYEYLLGLLGEA